MKRSEHRKEETSMKTKDEAVMCTQDQKYGSKKGDWQIKNTMWVLDSGSTSHMTCDTSIFSWLKDERREISLADKDGKKIRIKRYRSSCD